MATAVPFTPFSPFTMFQPNGPLGFFPNNFAANAGDLPNVLWVSSLQTPLLNTFSPAFPPLVTGIFGNADGSFGPLPLGQGFRPAPIGAAPVGGVTLPPASPGNIGGTTGNVGIAGGATNPALNAGSLLNANNNFLQSIMAQQQQMMFPTQSASLGSSLGSLGNLGGLGSIGSLLG
ncbi:MAG: hypothetical protein VKJ04_11035 [Vampirovibrionales bacterium]|nr:hypothetical protein [Vampirovibrionales bacterium]